MRCAAKSTTRESNALSRLNTLSETSKLLPLPPASCLCAHPVPLTMPNLDAPARQVPNFLGGGGVIRDDSVSPEVRAHMLGRAIC